jgi:NEDD8-activating enzyme E1
VIVCGLDSIEARRWINAMMVSLVDVDDNGDPDVSAVIPIVDGGTEGVCTVVYVCVM